MYKDLIINANRYINQLKTDMNTREGMKQQNRQTGLLDAEINGTFKQLDNELDQLDQILKYPNQQETLLVKEQQKRKNLYIDLANQRMELKKRFEQQHTKSLQTNLFQNQGKEKNYDSYGKLTQKQYQEHIAKEDEKLGKLNENANNIKYISLNINKSIQEQNGLIHQLTTDTTNSNEVMSKIKRKMSNFSQQSSSWSLMVIIVLEIILFFLIILL